MNSEIIFIHLIWISKGDFFQINITFLQTSLVSEYGYLILDNVF